MRVLCVFSGGLDSMLASQVIRAQGMDVLALFFETPFFEAQRARKSAQILGLPIKVVNITRPHWEILKHPKFGYGANMNPCMDCHALMFRTAGEHLHKEKADFVITGEVLGQRPFSQNRKALSLIAFESGLDGLLLRPLSAKLLPETLPEKKGWVNRRDLLDFQGRSRKPQIELAARLNIGEYPSPAGGCLLTEKVFSRRLRDLMQEERDPEPRELELLKLGRHFRLDSTTKLVVGRNRDENERIFGLAKPRDYCLAAKEVPGPTALLVGDSLGSRLGLGAEITASYSDAETGRLAVVKVTQSSSEADLKVRVRPKGDFTRYMIGL